MNRLFLIIVLLTAMSCSNKKMMEVNNTLYTNTMPMVDQSIGDTINIYLTAFTNSSTIDKIEIIELSKQVISIQDSITFALTEADNPVTIDEHGNLSRDISSIMMIHPVYIERDFSLFGNTVRIAYRVSAGTGEVKDVVLDLVIANYVDNKTPNITEKDNAKLGYLFDPLENKTYNKEDYKNNINKIEMAVYLNDESKLIFMSPSDPATEVKMKELGYTDYDASEMRTTKFVFDPVFSSTSIFFDDVNEVELSKLTFDEATNTVDLYSGNDASFITQDDKKGVLKYTYSTKNAACSIFSMLEAIVRE